MKLINTVLIVIFLTNILIAQDFIISSDDIVPATFIQNSPMVFQITSGELLYAWEDYRHGDLEYYAQFFSEDGIKIGDNFPIYSNHNIAFLSSQNFLISKNIPYDIYYEPYYEESGFNIYIQNYINRQAVGSPISIYGNIWPWCGTGFMGFIDVLTTQNGDYLYCAQFDGNFSLNRISSEGSMKLTIDEFDFKCLDFSIHSWPSSHYTLFYFGFPTPEFSDTVDIGIYAATFNNQDQLLDSPKLIEYISTDNFYMWTDNQIMFFESINLSDSLIEIFYINKDSLCLNFFTSGQSGKIDSTKTIMVPSYTDGYLIYDKIEISNLYKGNFALRLSAQWHENYPSKVVHYYNYMCYFDESGDFTGKVVIDSLKETNLYNGFVKTGNDEFIFAHTKNNDIYAIWTNDFEKHAEQKLNDDKKGANQINPKITKYGPDNFFVSWQDEYESRGRLIDRDGNMIGDEKLVKSKDIYFLDDNSCLNLWKISNSIHNKEILGFTLFDSEWDIIKQDTIYSGEYDYYNRHTATVVNTDSFVILCYTKNQTELSLYDSDAELIKSDTVTHRDYMRNFILVSRDDHSFYAGCNNYLWLCSNDLTSISSVGMLPIVPQVYLGNDQFLCQITMYDQNYVSGTIFNISGDSLQSNINLAPKNKGLRLANLGKSHFISMYQEDSDLYAQVFKNTGIAEGSKFIIHNANTGTQKEPSVQLNGDKILFCWSDSRNPDLGYTIMGNLQPADNVVSMKINRVSQPSIVQLDQNYPNPFNPVTVISWQLPANSYVELSIYNVLGQKISTLVNERQLAGVYKIKWDASNVSSGIYYYRLTTDIGYTQTRKLMVLK